MFATPPEVLQLKPRFCNTVTHLESLVYAHTLSTCTVGRYGEAQKCTNCSTQHSVQGTIGEQENETWTRRGMGASRRAHDRMVFRL